MYKLIEWIRLIASSELNSINNAQMSQPVEVVRKRHAKYFRMCLDLLPPRLASHDSTRVTIAFFSVCGLDVVTHLDMLSPKKQKEICDWVYRHQVIPDEMSARKCGGFQGSSAINVLNSNRENCGTEKYKWGHLAMTYTGIAILLTLGDDLTRLNRKAIVEGVAAVQKADGSFSASIEGSEHDMRFVYCAAAICFMMNDWGTVDKKGMAKYILDSIRYDFGVSQHYEMESHGGTTFCALAALEMSDQLDVLSEATREKIIRWLIFRQVDGFNGRPNKPTDSCYSFWIGASLKILNAFHLTSFQENRDYLLSTQDPVTGGFSKWPGSSVDPFHTYFSLCGLSFIDENGITEVMPSLNITKRAYEHLIQLHNKWKEASNADDTRVNIE